MSCLLSGCGAVQAERAIPKTSAPFLSNCETVRYGPEPWQVADFVYPAPYDNPSNSGSPVVILIHGGGWVSGSRTQLAEVAKAFTRNTGIASFLMDYKLGSPETPCWPQAEADIDAAIAYVTTARAATSATGPVYLWGYSAGGTLAVKYALAHPEVRGVATVGSPVDLAAWCTYCNGQDNNLVAGFGPDWRNEDPALRAADPWPPLVMMHGSREWLVPASVNKSIVDNVPGARLLTLANGTHDCHERQAVVQAEVLKVFLQ